MNNGLLGLVVLMTTFNFASMVYLNYIVNESWRTNQLLTRIVELLEKGNKGK